MVSFQVALGGQRWRIVGYIDPDNVTTIEGIVVVFSQRPHRKSLMLVGDINANLEDSEGYYC